MWPSSEAAFTEANGGSPSAQEILFEGMLTPENLLDLVQNFVVFERDAATGRPIRKLCRYQQFAAVNKAIARARSQKTKRARRHRLAHAGLGQEPHDAVAPGRAQIDTLQRMLSTQHLPSGPHPVVAQAAREMLNKSENELSGVFSTAMACLGLYRDPVIARNTSKSDFRITDLMNLEHPVSLYLVVPPSDLARTRPIIRLMLNQIGRRLTESMEFGGKQAYRHRLLLLLDEFPSLGKLDFFETALAFIAGYGLKAFLIAQSLNQLEKAYGQNNSILDNCHLRFTYAANDDKTAKRISDLLGQSTEKKMQKSFSGSGFFLSNRSESEQEYARPLLTPAEVNQLSQDDGILLVGGLLPYRARKVRYFLDPRFKGRDGMPTPDAPEEQRRELPPAVPNDWVGHVVAPPAAPSSPEASPLPVQTVDPPSASTRS